MQIIRKKSKMGRVIFAPKIPVFCAAIIVSVAHLKANAEPRYEKLNIKSTARFNIKNTGAVLIVTLQKLKIRLNIIYFTPIKNDLKNDFSNCNFVMRAVINITCHTIAPASNIISRIRRCLPVNFRGSRPRRFRRS